MRRLPLALLVVSLFIPGVAPAATPPPTPVPPNGSPSPFPTSLETPTQKPGRPPETRAKASLLLDPDSGQILYADHPDQELPVASLTKVMTALLTIEESSSGEMVTVSANAAPPHDLVGISALGLREGERISVENLLYALLLQSAGDAAVALAEHVSGSTSSFVRDMNRRAVELGAEHTHFMSPSGLDDRGFSSARDMATIAAAAFGESLFTHIVGTKFRVIPGPQGGPSRRIQNRNVLLWLYPGSIGGKTGFTSKAGFCLIAVAERQGRRLMAVVLGEPGEPFSDAAALLNWGFDAFESKTVVTLGQTFGRRQVGGSLVDLAAGADLAVLVPVAAKPTARVVIEEPSGFGLQPGDPMGEVVVSADGRRLGQVGLVVADVVQQEEAPSGSWWTRAASAVYRSLSAALDGIFGG